MILLMNFNILAININFFAGMTLVGTLFSVTLQLLKIESLMEQNMHFFYFYITITIIFITFSISGIITTILVFKPRESKEETERNREGFFYFGHVSKYSSSDEYFSKIKQYCQGKV